MFSYCFATNQMRDVTAKDNHLTGALAEFIIETNYPSRRINCRRRITRVSINSARRRIMERIARIMTFSEPVSHSEPLLKSLNLLKCHDIIHSEILSFVYQRFHKLVPSCFLDFFKPISSIHEYPTRQSLNENLFIKSIRTTQ